MIVGGLGVWWISSVVAAALALGVIELALRVATPIEGRIALRYQRLAEDRLRNVSPRVIGITGSWGKTSTKYHIRDLASPSLVVTISPASFNNRAGISRTVNEHLSDGTELLVAEMGMYGPGEIRELCKWVRPEIGVITGIGPMHLSRAGSLANIVAAKAELVEHTTAAVLWIEDPELDQLAEQLAGEQQVWRCGWSGTKNNDVSVERRGDAIHVYSGEAELGATRPGSGAHPANVACAVAALLAYGMAPSVIGSALRSIDVPDHRGSDRCDAGVTVFDDTFNSNPSGADAALARLSAATPGRRVVVTPGMFELGELQDSANQRFAREVVKSGAELIVVGRSNRAALARGAAEAGGGYTWVRSRDGARARLRSRLEPGDAVLWENDLPDHYP
jgi:UDP-N-acetylmuramoyl-tripeptide--D-alanyl-D-alanine ligase